MFRILKKINWYLSGLIASIKIPINDKNPLVAVTGTDGKTTTVHFLYEIAKEFGYNPVLISTNGVKYKDKYEAIAFKTDIYFSFAIKNTIKFLLKGKILTALSYLVGKKQDEYNQSQDMHRTTPLASDIRQIINKYDTEGANFFILEVTSHSLDQYRIFGIHFDSVGFTNITNEHLDYHGTWENYATAKSKLISLLKPDGFATLNEDDQKSYKFLINNKVISNLITYSKEKKIDTTLFYIYWLTLEKPENSTKQRDNHISMSHKLLASSKYHNSSSDLITSSSLSIDGDYNISNALCASGIFYGFLLRQNLFTDTKDNSSTKIIEKLDTSTNQTISNALKNVREISGRMNLIHKSPPIYIDFAHTPNGMEQVLSSFHKQGKDIWVVFGCAGLRDSTKRSKMGAIAYKYANKIFVSLEDPRTEKNKDINNEIISGMKGLDQSKVIDFYSSTKHTNNLKEHKKQIIRFDKDNICSRKDAIKLAVQSIIHQNNQNAVLLILGKGHEKSLAIKGVEHPWSDAEVVKDTLSN